MKPLLRAVGLVEETLAVLLLISLAGMVLLQVIGRYLLTNPFIWTEELTRLLLIWLTFVAAAAVTRRGMHIAVETGLELMPPAMHRVASFLIDLIMAVTFLWFAYLAAQLAFRIHGLPLAATRWSMSVMVWPAAAGSLLVAIHSLIRVLARIGAIKADIAFEAPPEEAVRS